MDRALLTSAFEERSSFTTSTCPEQACKKAVERIARIKKEKAKDIQVAFIAINKKGVAGSFALHPGFSYALKTNDREQLIKAKSFFPGK